LRLYQGSAQRFRPRGALRDGPAEFDGGDAHVMTTMVAWRGGFVIPSSEIQPGVRSPEVWFVEDK
jgi:hypothetical protein